MVYIKNKTAEIYAKDSKAMYDSIRRAVKEATGYDIYIVAESADVWCNQMRYQYFLHVRWCRCCGKPQHV